jgi:hypothetical protein
LNQISERIDARRRRQVPIETTNFRFLLTNGFALVGKCDEQKWRQVGMAQFFGYSECVQPWQRNIKQDQLRLCARGQDQARRAVIARRQIATESFQQLSYAVYRFMLVVGDKCAQM